MNCVAKNALRDRVLRPPRRGRSDSAVLLVDAGEMNEQAKGVPSADQWDHDHADSPELLLLGGPIQERAKLAKLADPCQYATSDDPPMLVVHGRRDALAAHGQSELLVDALKKAGMPVEFRSVERAGHGDGFGDAEQQAAEDFLIKHLKP